MILNFLKRYNIVWETAATQICRRGPRHITNVPGLEGVDCFNKDNMASLGKEWDDWMACHKESAPERARPCPALNRGWTATSREEGGGGGP